MSVATPLTLGAAVPASATFVGPRAVPTVNSFTLINADTDLPIAGYNPIAAGATLDLNKLPTKRLNVRANVGAGTASVKFGYDANANYRIESSAPLALAADDAGNYRPWTPTVGSHTIKGTPYSLANAKGTAGTTKSLSIKVVATTTPTVSVAATDASAKEPGTDTGRFTVTRTGSTSASLTVKLTVAGSATEGTDYQALTRSLVIPAGSASAAVTVKPLDDFAVESAEKVVLSVAAGTAYAISSSAGSATVTINDNDVAPAQSPFLGTPFAVPSAGVIQAEDFDNGGRFVAWKVEPPEAARTNAYRPGVLPPVSPSTDPADAGTGWQLDQVPNHSFLEYSADVSTAGLYTLEVRYAAGTAGGLAHLQVNDVNSTGAFTLPSTGGWDQWQTLSIPGIALAAGPQTLGLSFDPAAVVGDPVASVNWFRLVPTTANPVDPPATGALPAPAVAAAAVGTTGLNLSWANVGGDVTKYRVAFAAGDYAAGPAGQWQVIEVPASTTNVTVAGLRAFTQYTLRVSAVDAAGNASPVDQELAWTAAAATTKRYLYSFHLPKKKPGFETEPRRIEVYDVANGHQWVKNIPLPAGIFNVRGVAANVATNRLYFTYFHTEIDAYQTGGLCAMDLTTGQVIFKRDYAASEIGSPDRFDITPDGKTLYIPAGEHGPDRYWAVVDAATGNIKGRVYHVTAPHNTIVSLDGTKAFLEGQEKSPSTQPPEVRHTVGVVDTATNTVTRVGPFAQTVRPFTVNGKGSLIFATMNKLVGFQVGDVATGQVLYTAKPPAAYPQPDQSLDVVNSHGIGLTPDEEEVWVVDTMRKGYHVFDVSNMAATGGPVWTRFVAVRQRFKDMAGNTVPEAANDVTGNPSWIASSWDGKYMYSEGGEVIDVASHAVVAQLRAKQVNSSGQTVLSPTWSHSRFLLEIQFDGGAPVRATKQFAIGKVR